MQEIVNLRLSVCIFDSLWVSPNLFRSTKSPVSYPTHRNMKQTSSYYIPGQLPVNFSWREQKWTYIQNFTLNCILFWTNCTSFRKSDNEKGGIGWTITLTNCTSFRKLKTPTGLSYLTGNKDTNFYVRWIQNRAQECDRILDLKLSSVLRLVKDAKGLR